MSRLQLCGIGDEAGRRLQRQISAHAQLGWRAIELRTVAGVPAGELDAATVAATARHLGAAGLEVPAIASSIGGWQRTLASPLSRDRSELRAIARVASAVGARTVRVMSYVGDDGCDDATWRREAVRRLRILAGDARDLGLRLAVENCAGWAAHDATRAAELLAEVDSPALGILFDTGNPVVYGGDGIAYLRGILGNVFHVHVKDARLTVNGVQFTLPGAGAARVEEALRLLLDNGYTGALSIEPELLDTFHARGDRDDEERAATFVDYGRRFERLLDRAFSAWRVDDGALVAEREPA